MLFSSINKIPGFTRSAGSPVPALVDCSLIIEKFPDHNIRVPILGVYGVVAISRDVLVLAYVAANLHNLPRTRLPLALDPVNCVRQPADEGCVDHSGFPCLATAGPSLFTSVLGIRLEVQARIPFTRK